MWSQLFEFFYLYVVYIFEGKPVVWISVLARALDAQPRKIASVVCEACQSRSQSEMMSCEQENVLLSDT